MVYRRIDFRDLVRDLFALYKTRIWMAQIDSSFEPNLDASVALLTGKHPVFLAGKSSPGLLESTKPSMPVPSASSLNPNAARFVAPAAKSNTWQYDSQNY